MSYALYVCLQDEDKIAAFSMDTATGQLTPRAAVPVAGGPSVLAISPDQTVLYVGQRGLSALSSFRIDPATGGLAPQGTVMRAPLAAGRVQPGSSPPRSASQRSVTRWRLTSTPSTPYS